MVEISAVLVVKNEADKIKNCLKSVNWVDEIIVIDNQSTDRTPNIARRYADKFYIRGGGNYDASLYNKNFGIKKATKDWILLIDADEIITKECKEEILEKIKEDEFDAFYFNFKQFFFGKEFIGPLWTKTRIIRLFKKGKCYYKSMNSHEPLSIKALVGRVENPIIHNGYPDIETFIKKINNYTTWGAELIKDTGKGGLLNKKIENVNFYNLFLEPMLFFPYYFIIKKNYKDGVHGLVFSVLMSFYLFVERSKLWQLKNERKN